MRNPTVKRRDRWAPDILATDVLADHSPPAAFISHHATNPDQREYKGFGVTHGFGVTRVRCHRVRCHTRSYTDLGGNTG